MENRKKAESPIVFLRAVQQPFDGNALIKFHDTDDERLIGHVIPANVTQPELYLEKMSAVLDEMENADYSETMRAGTNSNVIPPDGIIKGSSEKINGKMPVQSEDIANKN